MSAKANARPELGGKGTGGNLDGAGLSASEEHSTTSGPGGQSGRLPLYTADGKVGGVILGGILTKTVRGSVHMLKNPPALALDCGIVRQAEGLGVVAICVTDTETGKVYRASITELHQHGWRFNRGYGWQYAMRLTRWHVDGDRGTASEPAPAPLQLALFVGV